MANIIGQKRSQSSGFESLELVPFPSNKIKEVIENGLIQKANIAQFLLGKLSGITLLLPNLDFFISSYIMKDAAASSQIEGTRATMMDAFEYVADPFGSKETDADDIAHYVEAVNYGISRMGKDGFPLSLRFIRELHQVLMKDARSSQFADPGEFRKSQNWIGGTRPDNAMFVPPAPTKLNDYLSDLEKFMHTPFIHPVIDVGLLHSQFETIHPFLDGNGRTGRLLITFYLMKHDYLEVPALMLSSYFKRHQKVYYEKLNDYHNGEVASWLDFFIEGVIVTAKEAIDIAKKITIQRDRDLELISKLTKTTSEIALKIVTNLYKEPIVASNTIQAWIGQSRQGTNKFIGTLTDSGLLTLYRKGEGSQPALYSHKSYLQIFKDD